MSLTLKIGSLVIRTLAKPIGNYIKRNAREHERFRKLCVNFAQRLHRVDMRMRLGLLQDPEVIERQIAKEVAEAEARRKRAAIPTVKTEAQMKAEEAMSEKEREEIKKKAKAAHKAPRIRPLSEAKAIETGANFISETFMFMVAGGIILFESWRSRRKAGKERGELDDRIDVLEAEKADMQAKLASLQEQVARMLPAEKAGQSETDAAASPSDSPRLNPSEDPPVQPSLSASSAA